MNLYKITCRNKEVSTSWVVADTFEDAEKRYKEDYDDPIKSIKLVGLAPNVLVSCKDA